MATVAQQVELYPFTWACSLAKVKTANIYTDSMPLEQLMTLGCYGNNEVSLPLMGKRLKMALISKTY